MEYIYIILVIGLNKSTIFYYILFIAVFYFAILKYINGYFLNKYDVLDISITFYDLIPLFMITIWFYGFLLGFYLENNKVFIISNFAGMVTYLFYYIMILSRLSKEKVFGFVCYAATIVAVSTIILKILQVLGIGNDGFVEAIFGNIRGGTSTGHERIYFVGQVSIFVLLGITFGRFFEREKYIKSFDLFNYKIFKIFRFRNVVASIILFLVIFYSLFIIPASKGFILGGIVMILIYTLSTMKLLFINLRIKKYILILPLIILLTAVFALKLNIDRVATSIFSAEDISNVLRFEQAYLLLDNINFYGNGLGAVLPFGYSRNLDLPYGFEVIFVNVFHKFGVFAVIILICYMYSIFIGLKCIFKKNNPNYNYHIAAFGGLFFLFPSLGNPILFNPQVVLIHCVSLYLLKEN